ncbi:MAG: hypothetical protein II413_12405, partial [Treponema sp.]|nr:hypothetical protein [Treponema sp.]
MQIAWQITINRHPELVSGSVPPFIRGSTSSPTMVRQAHQPWFDKLTNRGSTRLPYCIFVILVRGKSGMQKKARQVLEGPAEGGLRNKVEQWNPASATHGKCPAAKKQMDSKAKRRHTKNTGINFGIVSKEKVSTCKFTSIIVEYIQRTFRKNLPTFL